MARVGTYVLTSYGEVSYQSANPRYKRKSRVSRSLPAYTPFMRFPRHYVEQDLLEWARVAQLTPASLVRTLLADALGVARPPFDHGWIRRNFHLYRRTTRGFLRVSMPAYLLSKLEYYARDRRLTVPKAMLELITRSHGK